MTPTVTILTLPNWSDLTCAVATLPAGALICAPVLFAAATLLPSQRKGLETATLLVLVLGALGSAFALYAASGEGAIGGDADEAQEIAEIAAVSLVTALAGIGLLAALSIAGRRLPSIGLTIARTAILAVGLFGAGTVWVTAMSGGSTHEHDQEESSHASGVAGP